jgi:hypothetical protein
MGLRVLHVPDAVGGQAAGVARAERALGLESVAVALEPSPFGYEMDEVVRSSHPSRIGFEFARMRLLVRAMRDFDVVHFNFGRTILPPPARGPTTRRYRAYAFLLGLRDLPLLARAGKVIAVTFQGDDVRQGDVLRASYPTSVAEANPANYAAGDAAKRRIAAAFDRYADSIYYLNPDLGHVLPERAEFLPYASVDPRDWTPAPPRREGLPLVVHAPSDRLTKGTAEVLAAVERLRSESVPFEFRLVEGMTQADARQVYEQAALFIDQLHVGWYGAAAVELMALAKPVLSFLRRGDFRFLPDDLAAAIPIVNVTAATLADRLRQLLAGDSRERDAIGHEGRAYIERWHDPVRIATRLREGYEAAAEAKRRH